MQGGRHPDNYRELGEDLQDALQPLGLLSMAVPLLHSLQVVPIDFPDRPQVSVVPIVLIIARVAADLHVACYMGRCGPMCVEGGCGCCCMWAGGGGAWDGVGGHCPMQAHSLRPPC